MIGIVAIGLVKLSVCFLYWNVFGKAEKLRKILIVWIVIIICWTISFESAGLAECGSHLLALFGTPNDYLVRCGNAIPTGYARKYMREVAINAHLFPS